MKGKASHFTKIEKNGRTKSNDELREHLLCRACEGRLGSWERETSEFSAAMVSSARTLPRLRPSVDLPSGVDVVRMPDQRLAAALGRFGLSVFWRATVSTLFEGFALGPRLAGEVRRFLESDSAPFPSDVSLVLTLLAPDRAAQVGGRANGMDDTIVVPQMTRMSGFHRGYRFSMCNLDFRLIEGAPEVPFFAELDLVRQQVALVSSAEDEWSAFAAVMANAPARGALAKKPR